MQTRHPFLVQKALMVFILITTKKGKAGKTNLDKPSNRMGKNDQRHSIVEYRAIS